MRILCDHCEASPIDFMDANGIGLCATCYEDITDGRETMNGV